MPDFKSNNNDKPEEAKIPVKEDSLFDVQEIHKPTEAVQQ
jgi:hypothetical protein